MEVSKLRFFIFRTKVFAVLSLIFLNSFAASAQTQSESIYVLPKGKKIRVRMDTEINSRINTVNDTFIVRIAEPVSNNGETLLPAGLIIDGRILNASAAEFGGVDGKLKVDFVRLRLSRNQAIVFDAGPSKPIKAPSQGWFKAVTIGGMTLVGGLLGAASDAKGGALIGAAIGAGSGSGVALLKKGREVKIKTNQIFEIELKQDVTLPAKEY